MRTTARTGLEQEWAKRHPFDTDPATQLEMVLKVRDEIIGKPPYPNWTAVGVTWLAGFDVEIKVIARIPGPS